MIGTLVVGMLALIFVKIFKKNEEESEDYHRCGVSVPIEEVEI